MTVAGFEIRLRFPVWVDRIRDYWCDNCQRHRELSRNGRCPGCHGQLKQVRP